MYSKKTNSVFKFLSNQSDDNLRGLHRVLGCMMNMSLRQTTADLRELSIRSNLSFEKIEVVIFLLQKVHSIINLHSDSVGGIEVARDMPPKIDVDYDGTPIVRWFPIRSHNEIDLFFESKEVRDRLGLPRIKPVIVIKKQDASVCLGEKCYSIKGGSNAQRFKIITQLLSDKNGLSAKTIAQRLKKNPTKSVQDNIKSEIDAINKNFKECLSTFSELIHKGKRTGKNIYGLNREDFDFD